MTNFIQLYFALDETTATSEKIAVLKSYFEKATAEDVHWAVLLLSGKRKKRLITSAKLREIFLSQSVDIPLWLYEECYNQVGDTAETISLLVHSRARENQLFTRETLSHWMSQTLPFIASQEFAEQCKILWTYWQESPQEDILVLNKLLTGAFRVGVSQGLIAKALSLAYHLEEPVVQHKLIALKENSPDFIKSLSDATSSSALPYPFFLASPLESLNDLGDLKDWYAEWKWDGIRLQMIQRMGEVTLWSRGEEVINHQAPDLVQLAQTLPSGTVLDGEMLAWNRELNKPFQFSTLQKRLNRKSPSKKIMEQIPLTFMAFDILELNGIDLRDKPLSERRQNLEKLAAQIQHPSFRLAPILELESHEAAEQQRKSSAEHSAEGLMFKRRSSTYQVGRKRGDWWKFKVDPMTLDAVLLYAQAGSGKRANLFTDYTFALWDNEKLVPFAKAYSGLDLTEINELDKWIRRHTKEKFGPVRSLEPHFVFEIAFEGIQASSRHKSGIGVRFPRILRWRKDKNVKDANTLAEAQALIKERS